MTGWLIVTGYLLFLLLLGYCVVRLTLPRDRATPLDVILPLSFGAGTAIQCVAFLISLLATGSVVHGVLWGGAVALAVVSFALRRPSAAELRPAGFSFLTFRPDPRYRFLWLLLALLILLSLYSLFDNALTFPLTSYDGRTIWNLKAKILFHERTVFCESFTDELRVHYHRDYPLLVPSTEFGLYHLLGGLDDRKVRILFSVWMLFFLFIMYARVREFTSPLTAMFFTLMLVAASFRSDWAERDGGTLNSGLADVPLAWFACIATIAWYSWWRDRRPGDLALASMFMGFCMLTKKEGAVAFAVIMAGNAVQWLLGAAGERKWRAGRLAAAALGAALIYLPQFLVKSRLPNHYDEDFASMLNLEVLARVPERLPEIASFFFEEINARDRWNIEWVGYLAALIFILRADIRRREFLLDSIILGWLVCDVIVYCFTPLDLVFHLRTSMFRLMSQIYPILVFRLALFAWNTHEELGRPMLPGGASEPAGATASSSAR